MIKTPDPTGCPFCPPESDRVFYDVPKVLGLWSKFEVAPGHALVIPKRHIASWWDLYDDEVMGMMEGLDHAKKAVEKGYEKPDGYNIGVNAGTAAGQTVMHVHVHLIPRWTGDVPDPRGGVRNILPKGNYLKGDETSQSVEAIHKLLLQLYQQGEMTDRRRQLFDLINNELNKIAPPFQSGAVNPITPGLCNRFQQSVTGMKICNRAADHVLDCHFVEHDCGDCGRRHGVCGHCGTTHGDTHEKTCRWA